MTACGQVNDFSM